MGRRIVVPKDQSTYQARLRWLIVQRGMSIPELAAAIGFGECYCKRIIALPGATTYGRKCVDARILNRILDALMASKDQRYAINAAAARSEGFQL